MKRFLLLAMAFVLIVPATFGDTFAQNIQVSGHFANASNTAFSVSFSVSVTPTPDEYVSGSYFAIYDVPVTITMDGITSVENFTVDFYNGGTPNGGFDLWTASDPNNYWGIWDNQLYAGDESAPVFFDTTLHPYISSGNGCSGGPGGLSGCFADATGTSIDPPVETPEPASLLLLCSGLGVLARLKRTRK